MLSYHRAAVLALAVFVVTALPLHAADQKAIDKAVAAGVEYLKGIQDRDGTWNYEHADRKAGATALVGLALLECDVSRDDPVIQKAAKAIRPVCIDLDQTYGLSLCILFLDRLGDPDDVPLIESMAVRLMAGQNNGGGWTYTCPNNIGIAEIKRLGEAVKKQEEKRAPKKGEDAKSNDDGKPGNKKGPVRRDPSELPKEIRAQLEVINRGLVPQGAGAMGGDNSNTQFAILALWVARRHGLPTDKALARIDARFRNSQNADGGWSYMSRVAPAGLPQIPGGSSPAMTCAGLLGLAAGHGVVAEAVLRARDLKDKEKDGDSARDKPKKELNVPDPGKDVAVKAGLKALGTCIGEPLAKDERLRFPELGGRGPGGVGPGGNRTFYFLWSLERVAVAFGLDTIGDKDWYGWGSDLALSLQQRDGSWAADNRAGGVDTSFALLFLRRANLAGDLTASLKGKVSDPGRVTLKGGAIGDNKPDLKDDPKPKPDPRDKPPIETKPPVDKPIGVKPPEPKGDAERMASELVQANPVKQERLLGELRETKGANYTQALLAAIPKLDGEIKKKAREALAERMSRMTSATLETRLKDDDAEMRRAAALACAMKEELEHVPALIGLLEDSESSVSRAAYASLKALSNKDFGPKKDADRADRDKAVAAWKAWWKEKGGK